MHRQCATKRQRYEFLSRLGCSGLDMARNRGLALSVALLTCLATITSVRWLSALIIGENDSVLPATTLRHQEQGQYLPSTHFYQEAPDAAIPSSARADLESGASLFSFLNGRQKSLLIAYQHIKKVGGFAKK